MTGALRGACILLVGLGAETRALLEAELLEAGYRVSAAMDEAAALAALEAPNPPDLVILDAALDGTDSVAVCAAIKGSSRGASIPVIVMGGRSRDDLSVRAVDVGADDFLIAPTPTEEMLARVRSLLRVKAAHDGVLAELQRFTQIAIALSAEHNLGRLLERIVESARAVTNADGGTLYTVDPEAQVLHFQIVQNESLGIRMGGEHGEFIAWDPVALDPANVSAYVALTGSMVNIPDVYQAEGFDFSGPRRSDAITGYRSTSMLVVPLRNHEDEVIGVLQLINALDPATGAVVPFAPECADRAQALASLAGVAMDNARLISELQAFLEGLIQVLATAVDEKSHHTSGHIRRVTSLAVRLAQAVNSCEDDRFEGRRFSADELEVLRIAGLLHDIGKIVVPEHLVDKATKLQSVFDRLAEVRARFSVIRRGMELDALRRKLELVRRGAPSEEIEAVDAALRAEVSALGDDLAFLASVNGGGEAMAPGKLERLHAIASRTYLDDEGVERPYLTDDEVRNLSIARGTLLPEEFAAIRAHAAVTARLLQQIPFGRRLRRVPTIAGDHHETLDGTGYPGGKTAEELPLESRILGIVDIFDALTAADRPYKNAYPIEVAQHILREEAARGRLDARLVELFISAACWEHAHEAPGAAG